jgi:hypothetical protein
MKTTTLVHSNEIELIISSENNVVINIVKFVPFEGSYYLKGFDGKDLEFTIGFLCVEYNFTVKQ